MNTVKLLVAFFLYALWVPFGIRKSQIWLIGERKGEAKDNGYHLFRYIRQNHPHEKVFYVIERSSEQSKKVEDFGNVLSHNSLMHYIAILRAKILVQAFQNSTFPESKILWYLFRFGIFRKKVAMIQHGVTKDYLEHLIYNRKFKYALLVAGAQPEHEYMLTALQYPSAVAKYLGFARWDRLHSFLKVQKTIFVMPTWRAWLRDMSREEFIASEFSQAYLKLLNSRNLQELLNSHGYQVVVYLHDAIQESWPSIYEGLPGTITVATQQTHDVQDLIGTSQLLLTDYSSVAFDFAYLGKPTVYYQFDEDRYRNEHFAKGYFNYHTDGFGPVHSEIEPIVAEIEKFILGGCTFRDGDFGRRMERFFPLRDARNCERNFQAIKALK